MDENNILWSMKKLLTGSVDDDAFDAELLIHINTIFSILARLGVGPESGFTANENSMWAEFTKNDPRLSNVKSYMYLKVRLIFDPPANSTILQSFEKQIKEMEFDMNSYSELEKENVDEQ